MARSLISNPPYNLRHKLPDLASFMPRYSGWTLPPESNANYAFILTGLSMVDGKAVFLLPNSVINTSVKEEAQIRKELIKENVLLAVIALPGSMFESTSIPTVILVFDMHKATRKIALVDLTDLCEEETRDQRGQFGGNSHENRIYHKTVNVIPEDVIKMTVGLIDRQEDKENVCKWVLPEELVDYNLTPKRYFDHKTEIVHRSFEDIANDYNRVIRQKNAIKICMNRTAAKRLGYDCLDVNRPDLTDSFGVVGQKPLREDNISFTNSDGIKITISTKDGIHPLIIDFLNHWKQMIMYLNAEENRYLAEFRDALLLELMGGKIIL